MDDMYTPLPADAAECPHCSRPTLGLCAANETVELATFLLHCPACGGQWSELRQATIAVARHWEVPVRPRLAGAGCPGAGFPPATRDGRDGAP